MDEKLPAGVRRLLGLRALMDGNDYRYMFTFGDTSNRQEWALREKDYEWVGYLLTSYSRSDRTAVYIKAETLIALVTAIRLMGENYSVRTSESK